MKIQHLLGDDGPVYVWFWTYSVLQTHLKPTVALGLGHRRDQVPDSGHPDRGEKLEEQRHLYFEFPMTGRSQPT